MISHGVIEDNKSSCPVDFHPRKMLKIDRTRYKKPAFRYDTGKAPCLFFCTERKVKMEAKLNSFLETEKTGKLIRKFSLPCVISLLVGALYNIVDQIYIANADYLGSNGNAANTVVFPMTVFALAIAVMIGDGACAFVSISLGKGDNKEAGKTVGNAIIISVLVSIILTALYLILMDPLITLFGGNVNSATYALSREYFLPIALGIPFYMFGQALNPIIRSDSSPRFAMISTLTGAIINIILDPVFIYTFHWGMMGAAVATVIGQIVTAALSIWYLFHMKAVKLEKKDFALSFPLIKRFLSLGVTSFLSQLALVISMAAVQKSTTKYSALDSVFSNPEYSQIPLAVLGIVMKFFQIAISVAIGIAAGSIPIVGYNKGAGRNDRVKELLNHVLLLEVAVGGIALIIVEFFPFYIVSLFGAGKESIHYTQFAIRCFRIYLCMMIPATVNKGTFIFLQALGKAKESTLISLMREVVFGVLLPVIMPVFMGLEGILWSFPVADILTLFFTIYYLHGTYKSLSTPV